MTHLMPASPIDCQQSSVCVKVCHLVTHIAIDTWPAGLRQGSALVKQGLPIRTRGTKRARTPVQTIAKASPVNGPLSGGSNGNDRLDKLSMDELEVHTWTADTDWDPAQAVAWLPCCLTAYV